MIIATAGHVDHGKTSLVHALTGVDTDRLEEEKQRGLTIDLGFAYTDSESGRRLGFVDVPGHTRFISNMLAGVSAIDCALLVIAADDGVMPQTREHLDILNLLGISHGLIALTKTDRVEPARIREVTTQIQDATHGTFLEGAEIFPVSSETGEGIETLQVALEVTAEEISARGRHGMFRLAIDRRFSVRGSGIVVTGSVFAGHLATGDELLLMPQGIPVRVRALHTRNQLSESAVAGDRCAVNITSNEVELETIHRGNWLTTNPGEATDRADVELRLSAGETRALSHWTPVHIHTAANHVTGRVALLESGKIEPGTKGMAQLIFKPSINLCFGDRVILRDQAATRTLGGGVVIDPYPPRRGRAKPERVAWLSGLTPDARHRAIIHHLTSSETGVYRATLQHIYNLTPEEVDNELSDQACLTLNEHLLITEQHLANARQGLIGKVTAWHEANPGKSGLPKSQMRKLVRNWSGELLDAVVTDLLSAGGLEQQGNQMNLKGFGVQLSSREQKVWQAAEPILREDLTKPPVLHDLAKAINIEPRALEKTLIQIVKTGRLVRPVKNRFFLIEGIEALSNALPEAAGGGDSFTVQQYRDVTGIGRNLCIEILEYFDRQGITRRAGDVRQIVSR